MCVAQYHGIDVTWIETKLTVFCSGFAAMALEKSTVEENAFSIHLQFMAGSCYFLRSSM